MSIGASTHEARKASGGSPTWRNSLARSLLKPGDMKQMTYGGQSGEIQLWWGPTLPVQHGSIIHCFQGPFGLTPEWIDPPADAEPGVTTIKVS